MQHLVRAVGMESVSRHLVVTLNVSVKMASKVKHAMLKYNALLQIAAEMVHASVENACALQDFLVWIVLSVWSVR